MFALGIIGAFVPSIVGAADSCKVQLPPIHILFSAALATDQHAHIPQRAGSTTHVSSTTSMASLLTRTDLSMRSNIDKEIETADLDQLFDQYLETDLFKDYSNATTGQSSSQDLSYLFEQPSSNESETCETSALSALPDWAHERAHEMAPWRQAVERLEKQNTASPLIDTDSSSIYPYSGGKASLSDPTLSSFEELFILDDLEPRPASQPSTPKSQITKPDRKSRSSPVRRIRHGISKSALKKPVSSSNIAKMMQPSTYRVGFEDLWTRKMDTTPEPFCLPVPPHGIDPPESSAKVDQDEEPNDFFPREPQPYTIDISPLPAGSLQSPGVTSTNYQITPLSSPAIDLNSQNNMGNTIQFTNDGMGGAYITNTAALSALQTPPPSGRIPMETWANDPPIKLEFDSFTPCSNFPPSTKTTSWWGSSPRLPPGAHPSTPSTYQRTHSRSASQNLSFGPSSSGATGLGISCDTTSYPGYPPDLGNDPNGLPHPSSSLPIPPYAAIYPTTPGIPIGHGPANPPSRSPSLSPQPRFTRRRHSSHPHHSRTASRRKSSNSSQQSAHAHNRGASMGGGFVNFTPDDSRKILTGVAPSGSSKTKARREKEAAEKRRKLSQAAVKAIMEAGGDVGRLEKEGLLVLEG